MEKRIIRKIVLSINREILTFIIVDRKIYYTDRKFGALIRIMPRPKNLVSLIARTRNRVPMFIANLFNFTKEELAEYEMANTVDKLAEIIIRDGKKNGCILVANRDMEADAALVDKITSAEVIV